MFLKLFVPVLLVALGFGGCASGRVKADAAIRYPGHVVDSVELRSGEIVVFDTWNNQGHGQDIRARIDDDAVVGQVSGTPTRIFLQDTSHVTLGKDNSPKAQRELLLVVAVTVVVVSSVMAYIFSVPSAMN
jgi:hypothetical protein